MINHHLNRKQRRYLQKAVGARKTKETLAEKFDRIRENQEWGKQIHSANVESNYIKNNEEYKNTVAYEKAADGEVEAMINHALPMSSELLVTLSDLGI